MGKTFLTAACLTLINCVAYLKLPTIEEVPSVPVITEWEKYGAYYEYDELFIEVSNYPKTRYAVNKRIRILTSDGAKYASVKVPYYAPIRTFKLFMKDSQGKQVALDVAKIRSEYDDKGVILFPKVTAGCQLDISIVYSALEALSNAEYNFYEEIPVYQEKFGFSYDRGKYEYNIKTYNIGAGQHEENGSVVPGAERFVQYSWLQRDQLPPSRIAYMKNVYERVPRVSVALSKISNLDIYSTWKKVATMICDNLAKYSFFQPGSKQLQKRAHEVTENLKSDFDKADALLKWVQENISYKYSPLESIYSDKILKKREGNMWEQVYLLKEMFKEIHVYKDIVFTRSRNNGGFDPEFVTPASLSIPLITAEIGGKVYMAYPFYRGAKLGEFPATFYGIKGLSIERKEVVDLPEPFSKQWNSTFSYEIDLVSRDSIEQKLTATFADYYAFDMRTDLVMLDKEKTKVFFQKLLMSFGLSNALKSCTVRHLEDRGKPLTAEIGFATPGKLFNRKDRKVMKLDHLFGSYFSFYDSSRTSPLTVDMAQVLKEEVTIPKKNGISFEAHLKGEAISNPLFSVAYLTKDNDADYYFSRTITINKVEISAQEMRRLFPDIVKLKETQ
jgi:transglutaminase-like putative cysteine protease